MLPLLPIVLGAAASEQKWGPAALAVGLSLSFVAIGLFVATIGFSIGLDADVFRYVAAVFIIAIGVVLMVPRLQTGLAAAGGPMAHWAHHRFGGLNSSGPDLGDSSAGSPASSGWVCCSVRSGAPASGRRSVPLRCWRPRGAISARCR